jgi:Cd2+/Zn2+-exporting ATPase
MAKAVFDLGCRGFGTDDRPETCHHCVAERLAGLDSAEIERIEMSDQGPRVEIRYDPDRVDHEALQRAIDLSAPADRAAVPASGCLVIPLQRMPSRYCERRIERLLTDLPLESCRASYPAGAVCVRFDPATCPLDELVGRLERAGYQPDLTRAWRSGRPMAEVAPRGAAGETAPPKGRLARWAKAGIQAVRYIVQQRELLLVLVGGLLVLGGFVTFMAGGPLWLRLSMLAIAAILTSTRTLPQAIEAVRSFKLDVDVLMFVAAGGAAVLGHFEEGAFLLFLFGLGSAGEHLALGHARSAIQSLSNLAPETAHRLNDDGQTEEVPIEQVEVGDRVVVWPHDRLPADGRIEKGGAAIDEASITGESVPVDKGPGDLAFAGTMNGAAQLTLTVEKRADQSTLARIITLVEEAQTHRSPTQVLTDRIERWYVPSVFAATVVLVFVPPLIGAGSWAVWFYRAMAFLTAASPCALAIGTPAAVLCGIGRAARVGVLIKGGGYLEQLGRVTTIGFDKTGTLTTGKPRLSAVVPLNGESEADVLALAAAVESQVHHPLAEAIVQAAEHRGVMSERAEAVEQQAGVGAVGQVDGQTVRVGRPAALFDGALDALVEKQVETLTAGGKTVVAVRRGDVMIGLLALADEPRDESVGVLSRLHELGVRRVVMLTGDHEQAARSIAQRLGVDQVEHGLMPEEKLKRIEQLAGDRETVAMVGDGVNDAPALAASSLGIAVGAAGADVAIETADVVLMGGGLTQLPTAVRVGRASRRIIRQNLIIAMGVIAVVSPLAALGFANLALAVVLHEGSTVVVVLNALRLLGVKADAPPQSQEGCPASCDVAEAPCAAASSQ